MSVSSCQESTGWVVCVRANHPKGDTLRLCKMQMNMLHRMYDVFVLKLIRSQLGFIVLNQVRSRYLSQLEMTESTIRVRHHSVREQFDALCKAVDGLHVFTLRTRNKILHCIVFECLYSAPQQGARGAFGSINQLQIMNNSHRSPIQASISGFPSMPKWPFWHPQKIPKRPNLSVARCVLFA